MQFETSGPSQWQFKYQCNANAMPMQCQCNSNAMKTQCQCNWYYIGNANALPMHDWRWIGSISRGLAQVQNRKGTPFEQFRRVLSTNQRAGF